MKGIQICSNKGPGPLQRGDKHKNVKMRWGSLKKILRTMKPEKAEFYMKYKIAKLTMCKTQS
jgi:hypothetical protein